MKNKKMFIIILISILVVILLIVLYCFLSNSDKLEFAGKDFHRYTETCGENIYFTEELKMGYYEDCGNPVDSFDLCENYKYNKTKNKIIVKCDGFNEEFKVIKYVKGKELILERNGETLIFEEV